MTRLTRWTPHRELASLSDRMDRMFEGLWARPFGMLARPFADTAALAAVTPRVDLYETNGEFVAKVDIPGVAKDDLDVTVHEDVLVIKGETKQDEETKEEGYVRRERRYGRFERSIPLPVATNQDEVKASFRDGVLEIRLPKAEPAEPEGTKIAVE